MAGRLSASASASALEQRGSCWSSSITPRRAGSASASRVASSSTATAISYRSLHRSWLAHALHEEPLMPLRILNAIRAVRPVFLAVVGGAGLLHDVRSEERRVGKECRSRATPRQ